MSNPCHLIIESLEAFAPHFCRKVTWEKAKTLVIGTLLTNGRRVVTAALRTMGLQNEPSFNQYHHVLSRAVWSPLALAHTLLLWLVDQFIAADQPLIFGVDETIERRWGRRINARGLFRDAVRSSRRHVVTVSGLRWVSVMLLVPIHWAQRVWALPILTALSPAVTVYERAGRQPKSMTQRAAQMLRVLRRWLPNRAIVVVGDGSYASMPFLDACRQIDVTAIVRLRLDAALYDPPPPYRGKGRPRVKGARQTKLAARLQDPTTVWAAVDVAWYGGQLRRVEIASGLAIWYKSGKPAIRGRWVLVRDPLGAYDPMAIWCTHSPQDAYDATWIVSTFVKRWPVEVTFEEARRHLGVESQRQWSDQAIARTTPILFGLFSWVTLVADRLYQHGHTIGVQQSSWYPKTQPTFSDALATIRQHLWQHQETFWSSGEADDSIKISRRYLDTLVHAVCRVA